MKTIAKLILPGLFLLAGCKRAAPPPEAGTAENPGAEVITLTAEQSKTAGIKLAKAAWRDLAAPVEATGEFASDTDRVTQVRPPSAGNLLELLAAAGDEVEAGRPLFRYSAPGGEVHTASSPARGLVAGVYAEPGARLDPAVPVFTLADNTRLYCGLDVREKDISRVKKGQPVEIRLLAADGEIFRGAVTYISPRVDENTRTIKVRAEVENPAGSIRFGMFATGRILAPAGRPALAVPESAVREAEGRLEVFVPAGPGAFAPRAVVTGRRAGGYVEILSGLKAGEAVAASGSFILKSELAREAMQEGDAD